MADSNSVSLGIMRKLRHTYNSLKKQEGGKVRGAKKKRKRKSKKSVRMWAPCEPFQLMKMTQGRNKKYNYL